MSSKKRFIVEVEVTLTYDLPIYAADEDAAREHSEEVIALIIETQKYTPAKSEHYIETVRKD